jgi:chromosomal replication initiation ATPase DnaA
MKTKIFNLYVDRVCFLFGIEKETLFTKTKRRDVVDARHLLYYLCHQRPMRLVYIQEYMAENGYVINHSSIHHGIAQVKQKVKDDVDYINAVSEVVDEV